MLNVKNLLSRDKRADGGQDGANAPKEPFAALLPDEASREITAAVAAEFGWEKADVAPGTIADAVRTAGIEPSTQILLVDLGESADPEADIAALHDLLGNETALICVGTINDVKFYRQIHHAGAADYLVKPLDAEALRAAFRRIEESRERRQPTGERGRITVVIGTRGGVGASTVAANMAWLLADKSKEKVALIDLDFRFGTLALQLDLESGSGLHEALRQPDRVDELFLERSMRQAASNLSLLSTEEPLGEPSTFTPASIMLLLEQISLRYNWVVVDLPRHAAGTQREVLSIATDVILVAELSLASLRDTLRLRELIRLSAPSAKLRIVGCRTTSSKAHLAQSDYESAIKAKLDVVVPFDPVPLAKSANAGKPLAQVARNGKATATLRKLVAELRKGAIVNVPGSRESDQQR
jgi:pilus assembly protein CpaE